VAPRAFLLLPAVTLGLGCTLFTDLDGLAGGRVPGSIDDSGVANRGGEERADADAEASAQEIAFGNVTTVDFTTASCPCTLTAPVIAETSAVLLLAISLNGAGEVLPNTATYNGIDLGAPLATDHINYSRAAVWVVKSPLSAGRFSIEWPPQQTEYGVMMAAYYTGADTTSPYRMPAAHAVGSSSPGNVVATSAKTNDRVVSFFALNDTMSADGFTPERVGSGQTYRLQRVTAMHGSQLALSDGNASSDGPIHTWSYASTQGWAAVAVALAPAR
jgi:hypothetical protein